MKRLPFLLLLLSCVTANAQSKAELFKTIRSIDSALFSIVYKCDAQKIEAFFDDDFEFYHDKGGPTMSLASFMQTLQKNFCGENPFYLRREPVPGTMEVFPMDHYGALQTGEHVFYIKGADGKEILDGKGKYVHLWKYDNDRWRITRVVSYDHGPAK